MPYRKLRRIARWMVGPLVLSLLGMCLPTAQAAPSSRHGGEAYRASHAASQPTRGQASRRVAGPKVPAVVRSAAPRRNPRDDRARGSGLPGPGARRTLTLIPHALSTTPSAGATYPWEGEVALTNTGNGNKLTRIPLFGWRARGGLPVGVTLFHNSHGSHNSELGYKWTWTYDIYAIVDGDTGDVTVHWSDDLAYTFVRNQDGSYTPPSGIHDTLTATGNPISRYDLKTKDQVNYRFTRPNNNGWLCTSITDLNGNSVSISHNASDFITAVTDPTGRQISLSYDGNGRITTITDPLSREWTLSYSSGNLSQVTWPALSGNSYSVQFAYNANHCITTLTDRRGKNWTYGYNADNSLAWMKDPLNNQTSFTYVSGQTTITDPNGRTVKHNWSNGRLASVVDQLNNTESYAYDSDNNVTRVTDRRGKYWDFTYDSNGNVLSATDPLGHETDLTYNARNQVLTVTTPMGKQVVNTYDSNGKLTKVELKDSGGVVRSTTEYTWDAYGSLVAKTDDNGNQTSYEHDTNGHLIRVTTPNGRETEFGVNGLGVRTSRTDAMGRTTSYTLDNWLRVTAIDYPAGTDPTFSYDAENHLTGWTDGVGTWSRTYDDAGRITAESLGGNTRVSYTWDATGKKGLLSSITDASGRTVTYSYTYRNQLYQVSETAGTATYSYNANGQETGITNQNGTTVTKAYDDAGRLTSVTNRNSSNTVLSSFSYTYNDDDMRTYVEEANGSTVTYSYNGIGRLTGETRTGTNAFSAS